MNCLLFIWFVIDIGYINSTLAEYGSGNYNALSTYDSVYGYFCDNSTMNVFGCILSAIALYILIPIAFIPVKLCMFIYWICHYHN